VLADNVKTDTMKYLHCATSTYEPRGGKFSLLLIPALGVSGLRNFMVTFITGKLPHCLLNRRLGRTTEYFWAWLKRDERHSPTYLQVSL